MSRRERREREEREAKERKIKEKEEKKKAKIEAKKNKAKEKKNKKNKKDKKKTSFIGKILKILLKIILIIIIILCLIAGVVIGYLGVKTNWDKEEMLKLFAKQTTMIITGQTEEDLENLKPIYCLVMGVSTDIDVSLTDTIMICAYYPKTQQASILSIPRDAFVGTSQTYATGSDKINAIYAANGNDPEATLQKVEELTGLDIGNYIVVDTDGLVKLVDEIGGVYFDVPIDMKYDSSSQNLHINLKKGYQLIDGDKAEQLLRFRKNNDNTGYPSEYGSDDYGRMRTQRDFIIETIKQTLKLKNVTKLNNLAQIVFDNVDTNLDINEVLNYLPAAIEFNVSDIQSKTLPGESQRIGTLNLWFFIADQTETQEIIDEMFLFNEKNEEEVSVEPSELQIQILNGSGDDDLAKEIIKKLEKLGYSQITEVKTTITKKSKIIDRTGKSKDILNDVTGIIENIEQIDGNANDYTIDYTIIIGQDLI